MHSPYYQDCHVTLYHGDCLEVTEWLAADVLVTDPPYGMNFQSGQRSTAFDKIAGDDTPEVRDNALELWGERPAAVFGTWRVDRPSTTSQVLVWHKRGGGPGMGDLSLAFGTCHEDIYLLGRWGRVTKRRGSVVTTDVSPSAYTTRIGHPTPKPVGLMELLIESAPPGVIADPFAGGGGYLDRRPQSWPPCDRCGDGGALLRDRRQAAGSDVSRPRRWVMCSSAFLGADCGLPVGHDGLHVNRHSSGHITVWQDAAADHPGRCDDSEVTQ